MLSLYWSLRSKDQIIIPFKVTSSHKGGYHQCWLVKVPTSILTKRKSAETQITFTIRKLKGDGVTNIGIVFGKLTIITTSMEGEG